MAKLPVSSISVSSSSCSFSRYSTRTFAATINVRRMQVSQISPPRLSDLNNKGLVGKLNMNNYTSSAITIAPNHINDDPFYHSVINSRESVQVSMEVAKLHLIMEIVADRVEMHTNVGAQRDNWNHLLLTSINMMTLSAATMAALAANSGAKAPLLALKVSSTVLYIAVTGMLVVMNKIQPSQLAEEQRNAARLFKELHRNLRTRLSLEDVTEDDVDEAMEKVLALDKAYPLPLLGSMLEKFPEKAEPARWWPELKQNHRRKGKNLNDNNGWDGRLEEEMKEVVRILKSKDMGDYLSLSQKVLNFNKILAISGPVLTGVAALGSAFMGSVSSSWPVMAGVIGGALASVVNTVEHGGQVGMVFELYRGVSGFFKLMEETVEMNMKEEDVERREHGELLEIKVGLQLGRSVSELRQLAALSSSSDREKACDAEFASKLF